MSHGMAHHILVVDDDPDILKMLTALFTRWDYRVTAAGGGGEALKLLQEMTPDLILADYVMPGIDGVEFLKQTRSICPDAVRILITGHGDLNVAVKAINEAGIFKFITKPWDSTVLRLTVRGALEYQDRIVQQVQSEKMASLSQLAAGIAHEINNPVGFVTSNLETLHEYVGIFQQVMAEYEGLKEAVEAGDRTGQQESLGRIEEIQKQEDLTYVMEDIDQLLAESTEGMHRAKGIVEGLKSFARLDEAEPKEADLNEGIEETLKVVWNELKTKCKVHKRLGQIPTLRCYPGQLKQVFMNLLVNAVQAIPERGEVTVETEATETHVVVRVSDTGEGIPPEHLSRVFTPFFTTKPVGEGTGLGLAISYGIVEKHRGRIEVESRVGKGTTFRVWLPIAGLDVEDEAALVDVEAQRPIPGDDEMASAVTRSLLAPTVRPGV